MALNLSLRQLVVFREVMRHGSVSAAAKVLHRSQPALSAMLGSMERELGFELFARTGNRLTPKPESRFFLEEVEAVLANFDRAVQMMGEVSRQQAGQLRVACMPAASLFLVPRLISEFVRSRPDVDVSLMSYSSTAVHEWVASQQFDVGIAELPEERESLRVRAIETACLCAMRSDNPLAKQGSIGPADLCGKPLATLFREHFTHAATAAAFRDAGARFRPRFELRAFISGFDFVEQGLAYCICDPVSAASYRIYRGKGASIVFRPFLPRVSYPFAILTPAHKPPSLLAAAFCDSLSERITALIRSVTSASRRPSRRAAPTTASPPRTA